MAMFKKVKFIKVWMEIEDDGINFPITGMAFKDNILPLVQEKLAGWDEIDELNIFYEGIYRVYNSIRYLQKPLGYYQEMIWRSIHSHF